MLDAGYWMQRQVCRLLSRIKDQGFSIKYPASSILKNYLIINNGK
jgi:hypothetical protein